jgi:mono/diheme cytochrome c family protein
VYPVHAFIRRRRFGPAAAVVALLLAGCGEYAAYPEDLRYPLRTDPVVTKKPETEVWYTDPPGTLEQILSAGSLKKAGAEFLDPYQPDPADPKKNYIPAVDPVKFRYNSNVRSDLEKADKVPESILAKLDALNDKTFGTQGEFKKAVTGLIGAEGLEQYPQILQRAAKAPMDQATVRRNLLAVFGTPFGPRVALGEEYGGARQQVEDLKLDPATLAKGSVLYRRFCMQCHGIPGDGRGPTATWVNPHPRDYRQGLFKFISSEDGQKPRRADLMRTLKTGVEGTSMPSFALLGDEELETLISYVMHLSIRGEVEISLCKAVVTNTLERTGETLDDAAQKETANVVKQWYNATRKDSLTPGNTAEPPDDKAERERSIRHGYDLFISTDAGCLKCHVDFGRQAKYRYDDWGTLVRPRNLAEGMYRGGRRPIDLYWRLKVGIPGSGMPKLPDKVANDEKNVWDLIAFIQAVPYPAMLPDDIKDKVYDTKKEEGPAPGHH